MNESTIDNEYLLGGGAILATVIMASGLWDFFDAMITGMIIFYTLVLHTHKTESFVREIFLASTMALVSTAFIISIISLYSLAMVDVEWAIYDYDTWNSYATVTGDNSLPRNLAQGDLFFTQLISKLLIFCCALIFWIVAFGCKDRTSKTPLNPPECNDDEQQPYQAVENSNE